MLNVSKGEGELARARVGRGQGLRLTLDLNSNWVSHGTLPSDKQATTFSNIKYIVVGGGYLSKYLLFVLTTKSGCISGVGWTTGLSLSQSLKSACGPWQRDLGGGAQNQKWHESYKNETLDFVLANLIFNYERGCRWLRWWLQATRHSPRYPRPLADASCLTRVPLPTMQPIQSPGSVSQRWLLTSIENHFYDDAFESQCWYFFQLSTGVWTCSGWIRSSLCPLGSSQGTWRQGLFCTIAALVVLNTILICTNPIFHQVAEMQILRLSSRSPGQYARIM